LGIGPHFSFVMLFLSPTNGIKAAASTARVMEGCCCLYTSDSQYQQSSFTVLFSSSVTGLVSKE